MLKVLIWSKTLNKEAVLNWDGSFSSAQKALTDLCGSSPNVQGIGEEYKEAFARVMMDKIIAEGRVEFSGHLEDGRFVEITVASQSSLFKAFENLAAAAGTEVKNMEEGLEELTDRIKSVNFARPAGFYGK